MEREPDPMFAVAETKRLEAVSCAAPRRTVMQVTWSFVAGGSEMYAFTVAAGLDSQKYRSAMCALDKGGAIEEEIRRAGIPLEVMHRRPGLDFGLMWKLYKLFRKYKVDVVHTHHFNQLFYSLIGARLAGARVIHTEHSVEYFKRRRLRVALRWMSVFCDKVLAIGEEGARALSEQIGIPQSKLEIIRAGIDTEAFNQSRSEARRELGIEESARVAIIVARLFPEKNHRLLLRAFSLVARRIEKARLLIVGDGFEEDSIRSEIERLHLRDRVEMLGVRRDVARLLAASDVFVLSSDREGLPIAALEAMAARRPVVATSVGDLPLVVRDGETGRLVPASDEKAMAEALIELLSDTARARLMGERARLMVAEGFSLQAMIERHAALYG
jgi:glycosyltransferase involved in cell wall biosynthesis